MSDFQVLLHLRACEFSPLPKLSATCFAQSFATCFVFRTVSSFSTRSHQGCGRGLAADERARHVPCDVTRGASTWPRLGPSRKTHSISSPGLWFLMSFAWGSENLSPEIESVGSGRASRLRAMPSLSSVITEPGTGPIRFLGSFLGLGSRVWVLRWGPS